MNYKAELIKLISNTFQIQPIGSVTLLDGFLANLSYGSEEEVIEQLYEGLVTDNARLNIRSGMLDVQFNNPVFYERYVKDSDRQELEIEFHQTLMNDACEASKNEEIRRLLKEEGVFSLWDVEYYEKYGEKP